MFKLQYVTAETFRNLTKQSAACVETRKETKNVLFFFFFIPL